MVKLEGSQLRLAYALYRSHTAFFPIIAAVLRDEQGGAVYADRLQDPRQIYVEHSFGFAQVFGSSIPVFEADLHRYLLVERSFECAKVRLYTPDCPAFLATGSIAGLRSWRQRFELDIARGLAQDAGRVWPGPAPVLMNADASQTAAIEDAFGIVHRFWRSADDFVHRSNAVLAWVNDRPAALCYAAAVAGGRAEIDVITLPEYRHLGLARAVVELFNRRCLKQNLLPLWDCFTNNAASMALCRSAGFVPSSEPYPFFTINR